MKVFTCVVVGAGYAGIHALKEIRKTFKGKENKFQLRLILIDKNPYHLRKVMLFKPAVTNEEITIPLTNMFPEGVQIIQSTVTRLESGKKQLLLRDAAGNENVMKYDLLVMAAGSVIRQPDREQGGMPLTTLDDAIRIREGWRTNLKRAVEESSPAERERLMTIAIAGAGISGIETAAELAHYARADAVKWGLDPKAVRIQLYNAHQSLFLASAKVGAKLERSLQDSGIEVVHGSWVLQEQQGELTLSNGKKLPVGLCIWTLGLLPNPMLSQIGMPVTSEGYIKIDSSYRVQGAKGVYSIGDCARVIDPNNGHADGMTCKEAIGQAARLSKVILADLDSQRAPVHKSYIDAFSIGLGPDKGLTWIHKWGIDLMITGKLGWRIKKYVWDTASKVN